MIPWALIIAVIVLILAYGIKRIDHVVEEDHPFLMLIGAFFALYIVAALAAYTLNPRTTTNEAFATNNASVDVSAGE